MEITIGEGRKRQVRRMCEAVGHKVSSLQRVRFGPLTLGGLPEGESRALAPAEVAELYAAAGWETSAP
jgi:23S rRNA pseudouridine2605 synthase